MTRAATILAPNIAFSAALRSSRAMRPKAGREPAESVTALVIGSKTAAQRRPGIAANLGPGRNKPRTDDDIAAGDVERR